jgi:TRAP-type C4-dicarboxylate transport system permease small subunit
MKSAGNIAAWLQRRAENVAVALLAVMLTALICQIVFRYFINLPMGWTDEISLITWLWLVLWGAAFVVREDEEIRFELVLASVRPRVRRLLTFSTALVLVVLFAVSLPAVIDYVSFMRIQRSAYLHIPFDWLFSIYVVFAVAAIVRYLWIGWRALVERDEARDFTKATSGL